MNRRPPHYLLLPMYLSMFVATLLFFAPLIPDPHWSRCVGLTGLASLLVFGMTVLLIEWHDRRRDRLKTSDDTPLVLGVDKLSNECDNLEDCLRPELGMFLVGAPALFYAALIVRPELRQELNPAWSLRQRLRDGDPGLVALALVCNRFLPSHAVRREYHRQALLALLLSVSGQESIELSAGRVCEAGDVEAVLAAASAWRRRLAAPDQAQAASPALAHGFLPGRLSGLPAGTR